MKKNKVPELKTCVECGGVLEITDNLGYHTEPKTCNGSRMFHGRKG